MQLYLEIIYQVYEAEINNTVAEIYKQFFFFHLLPLRGSQLTVTGAFLVNTHLAALCNLMLCLQEFCLCACHFQLVFQHIHNADETTER